MYWNKCHSGAPHAQSPAGENVLGRRHFSPAAGEDGEADQSRLQDVLNAPAALG
jgi:hypothetical protein